MSADAPRPAASAAVARPTGDEPDGFLARWSRRKVQGRQGELPAEPALAQPVAPVPPATSALAAAAAPLPAPPAPTDAPDAPPSPTLSDVAVLNHDSDYTRFMLPGVDGGVKNAALKKLFSNPHFNVMDRLDTYIDDYGQPDPLPEGMLRQMAQSQFLGLFADEKPALESSLQALPEAPPSPPADSAATSASALTASPQGPNPDEDADLRLQPHDAAGPRGPGASPEPDPGRQC